MVNVSQAKSKRTTTQHTNLAPLMPPPIGQTNNAIELITSDTTHLTSPQVHLRRQPFDILALAFNAHDKHKQHSHSKQAKIRIMLKVHNSNNSKSNRLNGHAICLNQRDFGMTFAAESGCSLLPANLYTKTYIYDNQQQQQQQPSSKMWQHGALHAIAT